MSWENILSKKKGTQKKTKKFVAVQQPFPKNYADGNSLGTNARAHSSKTQRFELFFCVTPKIEKQVMKVPKSNKKATVKILQILPQEKTTKNQEKIISHAYDTKL